MRVFKNLNLGALATLVAVGILTVSWTESKKTLAFQWYQVVDNGPNLADKQIVGAYPGGTPSSSCSSDDTNEPLCAIELNLPGPVTFPITLQDVATNSYPTRDQMHLEE